VARLFNALVVVGAGISVSGCGGRASSDASGGSSGAPSGGASATGGTTTTGGTSATGGTSSGGSGATTTGGATGSGGANIGGAAGWTATAQWDCSDQFQRCQQLNMAVYLLDRACAVDPSRPSSPADCNDNEWLECVGAYLNGAMLAVNCECTPMSADGQCSCIDPSGVELRATCADNVKVCSCAHPSILIR
jgi:hypothetical protein